ncbi:EAL domain-containing protein [Sphingobium sp. CFD-2]|uniref:EAL domain-containing protein n=1 Tax=Sphingobium sp. CFD-2 TaxID=2878542 RepID=UPI00214ACF95|nr:EAL domain-containing protein [Sphingobium sp. CFD-2]
MGALDFSPICPDDSGRRSPAFLLVATIANLQEIEACFGLAGRQEAFERLGTEMRRLAHGSDLVEHPSAGIIEAVVEGEAGGGAGERESPPGYLIHRLVCHLTAHPIIGESGSFYPVPEIYLEALEEPSGRRARERVRAFQQLERGAPAIPRPWHLSAYHEDMKRAVSLFQAIERGGAMLVWQAVVSPAYNAPILYFEVLLRVAGDNGELLSCEADIRAIERVGLAPELDRRVMSHVLDQMEADPDVRMGVNISAGSASLHRYGPNSGWWELVSRLEHDPDLARRLVIEITETADLVSLEDAREFILLMQSLGCQVAIDDFGAGKGSIIQYAALGADIIKIDGSFVQRAAQDDTGHAALCHLVGLGRTLAGAVVVEGVETASQAELAREAGADWLQGYYYGRPSPTRAVGASADARAILALRNFQDRVRAHSSMPPGTPWRRVLADRRR